MNYENLTATERALLRDFLKTDPAAVQARFGHLVDEKAPDKDRHKGQ